MPTFDTMSNGNQRPSTGNPWMLLAGVALVGAIILGYWLYSNWAAEPSSPSPTKQSQLAPAAQEPQTAASARDTLVLALKGQGTPHG